MVAGGCVAQPGAFRPEVLQTSLALYETTLPWWNQPESNRQHPACKAGALPIELWPRGSGAGSRTRFKRLWAFRGAVPLPRSIMVGEEGFEPPRR